MRAALVTGKGLVELLEVPEPRPGEGRAVVQIAYCGVCGTDVHAYQSGRPYNLAICNGPYCTYASGYPSCSYYGQWSWYIYWQRNPDDWKQEQVNTWSGGPYWHRSGWF